MVECIIARNRAAMQRICGQLGDRVVRVEHPETARQGFVIWYVRV